MLSRQTIYADPDAHPNTHALASAAAWSTGRYTPGHTAPAPKFARGDAGMDHHPGCTPAAKHAGSDGHGDTDGNDASYKSALTESDAYGDCSDVDCETDESPGA